MLNRLPFKPTHLSMQLELAKTYGSINDYTSGATISSLTNTIMRINNTIQLPAHNAATTPVNITKENCIYIETLSSIPDNANQSSRLINLHAYKRNMYFNMYAQRVVSTGEFNNIEMLDEDTEYKIYGGDTFISPYSFIVYKDGTGSPTPLEVDPATYTKMIYTIPCESVGNIGLRHEGDISNEKYYPKSNILDNSSIS